MNFRKKSTVIGAFIMGCVIFTSTAIADVVIGSGYYQLKEAAKQTSALLTSGTDSFTGDISLKVKIDGQVFQGATMNFKRDNVHNRLESTDISDPINDEGSKSYRYRDQEKQITKYNDDVYYVRNLDDREKKEPAIKDIFQENIVQDAEKIMDAVIGNLKDTVQIEESNHKTMYTANLTQAQVPTIVNAVSSFVLKYSVLDDYNMRKQNVPKIKSDLYVQEAAAKAVKNEVGIIESVVGNITVVGKDEKNIEHTFTVEMLGSISDINKTIVAEPDLKGKQVEYSKEQNIVSASLVGKFTNSIVEKKDGTFYKTGERVVEITSAKNGKIMGRYYEVRVDGVTAEKFDFTGEAMDNHSIKINYQDSQGKASTGLIYENGSLGQNISFQPDVTIEEDGNRIHHNNKRYFDSEFSRQFD